MKTMQQLVKTAMENLPNPQPQSEAQPKPTVFDNIACRSCNNTWTVPSKYDSPGSYTGECQSCAEIRREKKFDELCPKLYQKNDLNRLPSQELKQAMDWKLGPKGLILIGDTGLGKSRVAWELLRRVLIKDRPEVTFKWFDAIAFGHAISEKYRSENAEDWLERLSKVGLVFFDDLGKLKMTERAETELFGLIERRCANELPIIATTNDTGDSLAARMTDNRGPAMIRRLREFCGIIKFVPTQ